MDFADFWQTAAPSPAFLVVISPKILKFNFIFEFKNKNSNLLSKKLQLNWTVSSFILRRL